METPGQAWKHAVTTAAAAAAAAGPKEKEQQGWGGGVDWRPALRLSSPAGSVAVGYGAACMRRWEVVAGRLAALLLERWLPSYRRGLAQPADAAGSAAAAAAAGGVDSCCGETAAALRVPHSSYFQLWLCCQVAVLREWSTGRLRGRCDDAVHFDID
jgi:hypothetical protein